MASSDDAPGNALGLAFDPSIVVIARQDGTKDVIVVNEEFLYKSVNEN